LVVPIFLAHLFHNLERKKSLSYIFLNKKILISPLVIILSFFLGCPYGVMKFSLLSHRLHRLPAHLNDVTASQTGEISGWWYYIADALNWGMGQPLEVFSLAAVGYGIIFRKKKYILLSSFPIVYYLIVGKFVRHFDRYILPLVPFLVILAAMMVVDISAKVFHSKIKRKLFIIFLTIVIILYPGIRVGYYVYLTTQKGTGVEAKEWMEKNISRDSTIAYETYSPPLSGYGSRNMYAVGYHLLSWYKEKKFDYLILSSFQYNRYFKTEFKQYHQIAQNYKEIEAKCELVQKFIPQEFFHIRISPTVKIYKINYDSPFPELSFPDNFNYYHQLVKINKLSNGWQLQSELFIKDLPIKKGDIKNPYVRLENLSGEEVGKFTIYQGEISESILPLVVRNSFILSNLPRQYKIYLGYEYSYPPKEKNKLELELNKIKDLSKQYIGKDNWALDFIYQRLPYTHAGEYEQMVILLKFQDKTWLWSKIFGGELTCGNDYVVDPYVKVVDLKTGGSKKLLIYNGKTGSLCSTFGPQKKSISFSPLSSEYKVYIGYKFYLDESHRDKAGGPLEIEVTKEIKGTD